MTKKSKKVVFCRKKIGLTPSVVAPGDTHPSDATDSITIIYKKTTFN